MGTVRRLNDKEIRIKCDCGEFLHDITVDKAGEYQIESYRVKGKTNETKPAEKSVDKPPEKSVDKPKRKRSIFDPVGDDDVDDFNADDGRADAK